MSGLSVYLKKNKKAKENLVIAPTQSLCDENGVPVNFTFRPISTKENDSIRDECTKVSVVGKETKTKVDNSRYMRKLLAISCVEPNLNNSELQDSYGVKDAESLICEMIDNPGEYNDLVVAIMVFNGFSKPDNSVEEVKN